MDKEFVSANDLVKDSFALAKAVLDSGYRPDVLLAIWRGGTPIGIAIHEFLRYKGIETYHAVVKAESYDGIGTRTDPRFELLDGVLGALDDGCRILIVDDIFDTGSTVKSLRERLKGKAAEVRVATLFYKDQVAPDGTAPDYFMKKTDKWIVFPHELMDLSPEEIKAKDGDLPGLLS